MRDPVEEITTFNLPLLARERCVRRDAMVGAPEFDATAEALSRKLEALARSPFAFFRGTFHLMARDLLLGRVELAQALAPEGLAVGDLHLENFGTYRGASGNLCFDVNDFDDVGWAPIDLDLKRLCTSALLLPGLAHGTQLAAAKVIATTWAEAMERLGGRFPIAPWTREHSEGLVRALLDEKSCGRAEDFAEKVMPGKHHKEFGDGGTPVKYVHPEQRWRVVVERALEEYWHSLEQLKAEIPGEPWKLLDVAYRFKGTGSLGRLRFTVLIGRNEERKVLEIKEARPSGLDEARGAPIPAHRARMQAAAIRRLQGDPWPLVAGTHLGELSALVREIEPEEEKISSERFATAQDSARHENLLSYSKQCGEVLARLHCRANAPLLLNSPWNIREAAKAAVAFAESYASVVVADHAAYLDARPRITRALTL